MTPAGLLLFFTLTHAVTAPPLTDAERARLEAGDVVIHDAKPTGGSGVAVVAMGVVDAPSPEVFPVVRDCQHFSRFMPKVKSSALLEEDGRSLCHTELSMPFPLSNLWSDTAFVVREEPRGHFTREWSLVRGTFTHNTGAYSVVPWGDGTKSLVVYALDSNPKVPVPDALLRSAQTGSLPQVFAAIRRRVVELKAAR